MGVMVKPVGVPKLTLAEKLALFDPAKHGGEVMATGLVGKEIFLWRQINLGRQIAKMLFGSIAAPKLAAK
jgi:hypothetical protein